MAQVDVPGEVAPAERPEFFEEERRRDDRGAGVEREAALPEDARAPAGLLQAIDDGDAEAAHAEADGGGQPPEACADDHGVRRVFFDRQRLGAGVEAHVLPPREIIYPAQGSKVFF